MDSIGLLTQLVREHWKSASRPLYLSNVPMLLEGRAPDALQEIKREGLKAFASRTASPTTYRLVEHPSQRAKIALTPPEIAFEFGEASTAAPQGDLRLEDVRSFERLLNALSEQERRSISLPASFVAKMLRAK